MIRVEPPRHQDHQTHSPTLSNAKTQRRKDAKPAQPPINAEARRRRDAESFERDSTVWRGSGRRTTAGNRWAGQPLQKRVLVPVSRPSGLRFAERRPRHFSFFSRKWDKFAPQHNEKKLRQNRRANGTSAGEKRNDDERSRSEFASFSPAKGDHQIACRSVVNPRQHNTSSAITSLRLCTFASLRFFWCSPLVSWCLGGFSFSQPSENLS